jgi:hypothetical protein
MRTSAFVIAALFGLASAADGLTPAQEAKKQQLEHEIDQLVKDVKDTKHEF